MAAPKRSPTARRLPHEPALRTATRAPAARARPAGFLVGGDGAGRVRDRAAAGVADPAGAAAGPFRPRHCGRLLRRLRQVAHAPVLPWRAVEHGGGGRGRHGRRLPAGCAAGLLHGALHRGRARRDHDAGGAGPRLTALHRRVLLDRRARQQRLADESAQGLGHRRADDLRHGRHHPGVQPEVLPLRLSDDRRRAAQRQPLVRRGRREPGLHAMAALVQGHAAAGLSGHQLRRHLVLRAVDRRLRHAVDHRPRLPHPVHAGLQPVHLRDGRHADDGGQHLDADGRHLDGGRLAATPPDRQAPLRRIADQPYGAAAGARPAGTGGARAVLRRRRAGHAADRSGDLHLVPADPGPGVQRRLRPEQLRAGHQGGARRGLQHLQLLARLPPC